MDLSDIKKMKVIELRARLKELGLDTKGLKAELVGRLWSAVEADSETEPIPQNSPDKTPDDSPLGSPKEIEREAVSSVPQGNQDHFTGVRSMSPPPCRSGSAIQYTDTGTQTDSPIDHMSNRRLEENGSLHRDLPHPGITLRLSKQESPRRGKRKPLVEWQVVNKINSSPVWQHRTPEPTEVHSPLASPVARSPAECTTSRHRSSVSQPGDELGREDPRPAAPIQTGRGRAFYEFKEEIRYKRAKEPTRKPGEDEVVETDTDRVRLDPYTSDLHFETGSDGSCGQPRFWAQFPLLWSGSRLSHGVQGGRAGFEVRLERRLVSREPTEQTSGILEPESLGLRVGWSVGDSSLLLGEDSFSYGYDGRGKKVSSGKEEEFGEPFSEADIIGCYVSFSTGGAAELSFHKNGRPMGVAFRLGASELGGRTLFPHVLCKSCSVQLNLDPTAPPWYPSPPGYTQVAALPAGDAVRAPLPLTSRQQCEVVMMVGLPGAGKTKWARKLMKQTPEKRYTLLSVEALLGCMLSGGQQESRLQQASRCLTELIKMAPHYPGNYILDQVNVLFSARQHKLRLFEGFQRRAVVLFPPADEWRRRLRRQRRREGEEVPETSLLKLQASTTLPEQQGELFEEVHYAELTQEQAQALLEEYKKAASRLLPPVAKQEKKKPLRGRPFTSRTQWNGRSGCHGPRLNQHTYRPYETDRPRYCNSGYPAQGSYISRGFGYSGDYAFW